MSEPTTNIEETKKPRKVKLDFLNDYLFLFNPYVGMWVAFKREDTVEYFNNFNTEKAIKNANKDYIVDYLIKIHNQK